MDEIQLLMSNEVMTFPKSLALAHVHLKQKGQEILLYALHGIYIT